MVNWNIVCLDKGHGGIGLRKLHVLDRAHLEKWIWKFVTNTNCIWKRILHVKFGVEGFGWRTKEAKEAYGVGIWKEIMKEYF